MSEEQPTRNFSGVEMSSGLGGVEHAEVVVCQPERTLPVVNLVLLASQVRWVAGQADRSTFGEAASDALPFPDTPHFIDRVKHLAK
jgi:hypothetical protein